MKRSRVDLLAMGLGCGLLAGIWWELRRRRPVSEYHEGDPGDETPEPEEFDIVVDLDLDPDAVECPKCKRPALSRPDGAMWCRACDEAYFPTLDEAA